MLYCLEGMSMSMSACRNQRRPLRGGPAGPEHYHAGHERLFQADERTCSEPTNLLVQLARKCEECCEIINICLRFSNKLLPYVRHKQGFCKLCK